MSYDFLKNYSEEVVLWYLTIEAEQGKPPYILGSNKMAGFPIRPYYDVRSDPNHSAFEEIRTLTCGVLLEDGTFSSWERIDQHLRLRG